MTRPVLILLILLSLCGCKPGKPAGILSEKKMENVLVDYHLAQGMAEAAQGDKDVLRYRYIQAVFRKHHVTEAAFDSSLIYYSSNAEKLVLIYKKVTARVEAQATMMGVDAQATHDQYANLTAQGDTANIWTDRNYHSLQMNTLDNLYFFRIPTDSSFQAGDRFLWRFNTDFRGLNRGSDVVAILMLEYENDTLQCTTQQIHSSGLVEINYAPRRGFDTLDIRSVGGFIYMPITKQEDRKAFNLLIMNNISLIRFHNKPKPATDSDLSTDSIETDTASSQLPQAPTRRLTPQEMRESQPKEKKVNVVKEKPYDPRRQQQQRRRNNRRYR